VRRPTVDERRNEILEAAIQVVIERGFGATRVADVATRLGISTGLVHYHFDSKDHLLAEALRYAAQADLARLREAATDGTALDKLDRVFGLYSPVEAEPGWMLWIDGWGEALRSPDLQKISRELDLEWQQVLEKIIHDGVRSGEFRCDDPRATAWRLTALLDGLGLQVTVHHGLLSRDELLAWVREAACRELDLPAGTFGQHGGTARAMHHPPAPPRSRSRPVLPAPTG
jgi:AcrR family transcriptional regulator